MWFKTKPCIDMKLSFYLLRKIFLFNISQSCIIENIKPPLWCVQFVYQKGVKVMRTFPNSMYEYELFNIWYLIYTASIFQLSNTLKEMKVFIHLYMVKLAWTFKGLWFQVLLCLWTFSNGCHSYKCKVYLCVQRKVVIIINGKQIFKNSVLRVNGKSNLLVPHVYHQLEVKPQLL